jgi:hypothetical protein
MVRLTRSWTGYAPAHMATRLRTGCMWLLATLALVVGTLLYLAFRDGLVLHRAVEFTGVVDTMENLRAWAAGAAVPPWVVWSLSDGLWQFALTVAVAAWWIGRPSLERWWWMLASLGVGVAFEAASAFGWIEGVFDPIDLLALILGSLGAMLVAHVMTIPSPRSEVEA